MQLEAIPQPKGIADIADIPRQQANPGLPGTPVIAVIGKAKGGGMAMYTRRKESP